MSAVRPIVSASGRRRRLAAALIVGTFVLGACGSGEGAITDATLPDVTLPDVSLPDGGGDGGGDGADGGSTGDASSSGNEPSDGSTGAATQSPADGAADPDDGIDTGVLIALIGLVAAAVIVLFAVSNSSRRRADRSRDAAGSTRRQISQLVNVSRWADGQVAQLLDLKDPRRSGNAISSISSHLADAEVQAARLAPHASSNSLSDALGTLGQSFAALRGSLTALSQAQPDTLDAARRAASNRRHDLNAATRAVVQFSSN